MKIENCSKIVKQHLKSWVKKIILKRICLWLNPSYACTKKKKLIWAHKRTRKQERLSVSMVLLALYTWRVRMRGFARTGSLRRTGGHFRLDRGWLARVSYPCRNKLVTSSPVYDIIIIITVATMGARSHNNLLCTRLTTEPCVIMVILLTVYTLSVCVCNIVRCVHRWTSTCVHDYYNILCSPKNR